MSQELSRNFSVLKQKADPPPYFLSYEITEVDYRALSATLGAVDGASDGKTRSLDVSVRVGSPKLDNYHRVRNDRGQFTSGALISFEDVPNSIKQRLWLETDRAYRSAAERLIRIKTNTQVKVAAADDSDDFSTEKPEVARETPPTLRFDEDEWRDRVRKLSSRFGNYPNVLTSHVSVSAQTDTRYFVNTEGARIEHGRGFARVSISASAKASDGTDLSTFETFEAVDPSGLPDDKTLTAAVDRVAGDVTNLLRAPEAEPFVGPAIFSGRAAGVFFHEIFGHRVEGHRQKDESEGQTFTKSVNTKVLPDFLSVIFDPTRRKIDGIDLNGWYDYDDEGVKARPVTAVDKGVLEDLPDVAVSHQGLRSLQWTRAPAARPGSGFAAVQPDRRIDQRGARGPLAPDADRRSEAPEQALRPLLPRHHRRLHHHSAGRLAGLQGDSRDRLPGLSGRTAG